jgi:hypothetical protein
MKMRFVMCVTRMSKTAKPDVPRFCTVLKNVLEYDVFRNTVTSLYQPNAL